MTHPHGQGEDGPTLVAPRIVMQLPGSQLPWSKALGSNWSMQEAIAQATDSANNLVAHATATHPAVKSLAVGLEQWQTSLRSEAQQRLGGFKPPLQITNGLLAEDWDLLKRVGTSSGSNSKNPALQLGSSFSMKRSASENSLETMNNSQGTRKLSKQANWGWEGSSSGAQWPAFGGSSLGPYAEAHASAMQAMTRKPPVGLITSSEHHAREREEDEEEADQRPPGTFFTSTPLISKRSDQLQVTPRTLQGSHPYHMGMPRVPTAPSLQELGETLNNQATRNLEAVRAALQNAQASIQETANNCQQNLQVLTNIFQQNLNSNGGPLQAALSNSRAMVTWSISNGSDPLGGALVPWQVFPRVLRARELDAQQGTLTNGEDHTAGATRANSTATGILEWVSPLEQYMSQLDGFTHGKRGRTGHGSVRDPGRQVAIVTTASLPWLTGTSVNPLLRAAYMAMDGTRKVTLVLPWLSPTDQQRVFPADVHFDTPEQQEEYVRNWARQRTGLDCNFKVTFYPSRYAAEKGSILPVGDITSVIPDHEADVAVLEEPEHLNWYHHGKRWTDKFKHVVGVMHTNYLDYARREENGNVKEMLIKFINSWVCRIQCHKVVKLSDAVQPLPRQETMFVHGVSPAFLKVGASKAKAAEEAQQGMVQQPVFGRGAYFLGKVLWAKGYTELLDRLNEHAARTGQQVDVDVYGSGPDLKAVEEESSRRRLNLRFNGAKDHADECLQDYKVFINPSLSDVVATTTAEALAMGKWVVCADHPSNKFFQRFPNCLIYKDSEEFSRCLDRALKEDPRPLSNQQLHDLTWEAATERFLDVADLSPGAGITSPLESGLDNVLAAVYNAVTGVEFLRVAMGAGARTRDTPARITDYQPDENDVGGFFDNSARAKKSWEGKQKPVRQQLGQTAVKA